MLNKAIERVYAKMKIYNESEKLVGLYQQDGLTAYVRIAKMTWSQDNKEHDVITFLGVKDENNNTILKLNLSNNNFWFYDEKGYINIVDEIENIMLFLKYYYCKLDEFNKNKVVNSIFFNNNTMRLHVIARQVKKELKEVQLKQDKIKIENDIRNIVNLLKDKYFNDNYRLFEYANSICVLKFNKRYSQKDIDRLSAKYIIESLENGSLDKYINKDFEITIPVISLNYGEYSKQDLLKYC